MQSKRDRIELLEFIFSEVEREKRPLLASEIVIRLPRSLRDKFLALNAEYLARQLTRLKGHEFGPYVLCNGQGQSPKSAKAWYVMLTPARCMDCKLPYEDPGFADLVIADHHWKAIAPDDGLLCPTCIVRRCARARITDPGARFTSGPFAG